MESPESAPKRAPRPRSPPQDDKEKNTHIRFLVSNTAAGCIIGKGGSTITDFQSQSGARIQLSRSHEFFPGTPDRVIMVSGTFEDVVKAMELILDKLLNEVEEGNDVEGRSKVRLIVPNGSCGCIIGKGGSTIKSFIEDSRAGIKISPQDPNNVALNDRLVTMTGSFEEQMRALYLILSKLKEDAHYPQTLSTPFPYSVGYMVPPVTYNNAGYGMNGVGGRYPGNKNMSSPAYQTRSPAHESQSNSVTFGIADEHIGAVVGRGGRNIMEISQISGARIKISDRGDFMSGTSDRKVTITGAPDAIRTAETMILQKVSSINEE